GFRSLDESAMPMIGRGSSGRVRPALRSATRCDTATSSSPASHCWLLSVTMRSHLGDAEAESAGSRLHERDSAALNPLEGELRPTDLLPADETRVVVEVHSSRV